MRRLRSFSSSTWLYLLLAISCGLVGTDASSPSSESSSSASAAAGLFCCACASSSASSPPWPPAARRRAAGGPRRPARRWPASGRSHGGAEEGSSGWEARRTTKVAHVGHEVARQPVLARHVTAIVELREHGIHLRACEACTSMARRKGAPSVSNFSVAVATCPLSWFTDGQKGTTNAGLSCGHVAFFIRTMVPF